MSVRKGSGLFLGTGIGLQVQCENPGSRVTPWMSSLVLTQRVEEAQSQAQWKQKNESQQALGRYRIEGLMVGTEVAIRLGFLDLGHHTRLELCHMVVNPGGITRGQSVHTRPVRGPTSIAPAHNACQVPEAPHRAGEWASRVTLRRKAVQQLLVLGPRLLVIHASPIQHSPPKMHLSHRFPWVPRIYLAGILAPVHIASTHHVLLHRMGLLRLGVNVVQAVTCLTADKWHHKLLQLPGGLEAHCGRKGAYPGLLP